MINVMDILEGKGSNSGSNLGSLKIIYHECIVKIKEIHTDEINRGLVKDYKCSDQTNLYINNLLTYLHTRCEYPEIVVWRGIAVTIKHFHIPLSQRTVPIINDIMKKYNHYLDCFFNNYWSYDIETKGEIMNILMPKVA